MRSLFRVALAQLNCFVGDCAGNARRVMEALARADRAGAGFLVTPELALTGYPPEDLLLRRDFLAENRRALGAVLRASRRHPGIAAAVGFVDGEPGALYDAAALVRGGRMLAVYHKQCLPNYGVFDERRYFTPGTRPPVTVVDGVPLGLSICEDLWHPEGSVSRALGGARLVASLNASPYEAGKIRVRERLLGPQTARWCAPLAYVNLVGGQDELVFDGQSLALDARGRVVYRARPFAEDFAIVDLRRSGGTAARRPLPIPEEVYGALVLGVRDYAIKNGFPGAVVGLSGGVDSALTACLAADALGSGAVTGISMPSRFTSVLSREEARGLARRLGVRFLELPLEPVHDAYHGVLNIHLEGGAADLARQNLQSRIRGALLMALSNRHGWLLLATGNKSEMSVGYATLYGDLAGGFAALKDIPKTLVYRLARWRNGRTRVPVIPPRTLSRPPTAELRPDQRDTDSLPPYPVLDPILEAYVERGESVREIVRRGFTAATVRRVIRLVERNEYKRRQAPPGVKITPRAFGKDRRNPISHGFRPWS